MLVQIIFLAESFHKAAQQPSIGGIRLTLLKLRTKDIAEQAGPSPLSLSLNSKVL